MRQIAERAKDNTITLFLSGPLEFQTRKLFLVAIDKAKRSNPQKILLNFSDVPFINSAGLGLLMLAHKSLKEANIPLILEVASGYVLDVFTLTNIGQKIPLSPIEAKRSCRKQERDTNKNLSSDLTKQPTNRACGGTSDSGSLGLSSALS